MMHFPFHYGVSRGVMNHIINNRLQSLINITSSSQYYEDRTASELAKGATFYTERNNNYGQWILFNFTKNFIDLEGYSLTSDDVNEYPSYWKIEVSPDGFCWGLASNKINETINATGKMYSTPLIHCL